jgi:hypothetical protein
VAEHAVQCDENLPHALCGTQRTASNRSGRKVDDHQHFVPEAAEAEALHQTPFLGFGFEPQEAQRLPVLDRARGRQPARAFSRSAEVCAEFTGAAG